MIMATDMPVDIFTNICNSIERLIASWQRRMGMLSSSPPLSSSSSVPIATPVKHASAAAKAAHQYDHDRSMLLFGRDAIRVLADNDLKQQIAHHQCYIWVWINHGDVMDDEWTFGHIPDIERYNNGTILVPYHSVTIIA